MSKKVILVIEDEYIQGSLIVASLQNSGAIAYWARTIEEAIIIFTDRNGLFDAILLDGCINSEIPNTEPLISFFKDKGFANPIVAISAKEEFSLKLISAGATCMAKKNEALIGFTMKLIE